MKRPWDAIAWWEIRRIPYNLVLLILGSASVLVVESVGARVFPPGVDAVEPLSLLLGVVIYGVAANLLYTLGWITEILWTSGDTSRTEALRPKIFWLGLIFSSTLTILPAIAIPLLWASLGFK